MILSKIQMDLANPSVVKALADRDILHKDILRIFPDYPGGARNARELMGILFRVEAPIILLQSQIPPVATRIPEGYRILGQKDVSANYLAVRDGAECRFRLEANVTWRDQEGRRHGIKEEEGREQWLYRRGDRGGFEVVDCGFEELPLVRARRGHFHVVRFDGTLRVKAIQPFMETLKRGVGQGKVYGLGMLSLAR